jgi:hypothetical protein
MNMYRAGASRALPTPRDLYEPACVRCGHRTISASMVELRMLQASNPEEGFEVELDEIHRFHPTASRVAVCLPCGAVMTYGGPTTAPRILR